MDIKEFIKKHNITIENEKTYQNPNMPSFTDADHWKCTLKMDDAEHNFFFSKGYGHKGKEPTADEVIECFVSDLRFDDLSFDEFCDELGFDAHRENRKTYNAVQKQNYHIKILFEDCFDELLSLEF